MKYDLFVDASGTLAEELRYLAKSISNDETRYFMMNIYVEYIDPEHPEAGLLGVATDGRRLHVVEPLHESATKVFDMKPGHYRFLKASQKSAWVAKYAENPGQFPAWRRVIPSGEPKFTTTFTGFEASGHRRGIPELVKLLRAFPEATAMNLKYLEDLGTGTPWSVEWSEPNKAVVFKSGNRKTVIMPISLGE